MSNYTQKQEESGLKIGDIVKVIRTAEDDEAGWDNYWTSSMDDYVGKKFKITNISAESGIQLQGTDFDEFYFPYFVLRKREKGNRSKFLNVLRSLPVLNEQYHTKKFVYVARDKKKNYNYMIVKFSKKSWIKLNEDGSWVFIKKD